MNKQDIERVTAEYLKPIFGFALKRCKNVQDAEDLSQDIILKAYRTLISRDDIEQPEKFIWTIAHNALSNYYRDTSRQMIGVPIENFEEILAHHDSYMDETDHQQIVRLQKEIAYLSKLQRRIVIAYYFENKNQKVIASELGIPLGTVKWHLFEAKKELKRGMDIMRETSKLKFNPVKFTSYGINGNAGTKSLDEFFRSTLSQNICYCVRNNAKTVNEIADDLGVSPVYIESEAAFLEEYGFLKAQKDKYIVNFIISEPTEEHLILMDQMYKRAAELFANELYDTLLNSGILDDPDIICHQTDEPISLTESSHVDHNFLLWSLIPYIAAFSGERLMDDRISFEQVATIRPDGGYNIVHAAVTPEKMHLPDDYVYMKNWCGPMWNGNGKHILWQIDSEWSDRGDRYGFQYSEDARRVLGLYEREYEELLSKDEYAWLAERSYIKTNGDYDGHFKSAWQVVILDSKEIKEKLLAIGERIKVKYQTALEELKAPYAEAILKSVPPHLKKVEEFELQFVFHSDGCFLLQCIMTLLRNGKLKEPTKGQRGALMTVIAPD